jgi:hypothetical protein
MRRAIKQSEISGARRRCNRNDRFLMWQKRLTGKCLQSKRSPDGMQTVYWRREVWLNRGEDGRKVGSAVGANRGWGQKDWHPKEGGQPCPDPIWDVQGSAGCFLEPQTGAQCEALKTQDSSVHKESWIQDQGCLSWCCPIVPWTWAFFYSSSSPEVQRLLFHKRGQDLLGAWCCLDQAPQTVRGGQLCPLFSEMLHITMS